ncbi:MAG: hypothetical protein KDH96_11915 [Candidatus Riesia sp.]|nr:hypothetical protein [Candidatus Riesia sp.]
MTSLNVYQCKFDTTLAIDEYEFNNDYKNSCILRCNQIHNNQFNDGRLCYNINGFVLKSIPETTDQRDSMITVSLIVDCNIADFSIGSVVCKFNKKSEQKMSILKIIIFTHDKDNENSNDRVNVKIYGLGDSSEEKSRRGWDEILAVLAKNNMDNNLFGVVMAQRLINSELLNIEVDPFYIRPLILNVTSSDVLEHLTKKFYLDDKNFINMLNSVFKNKTMIEMKKSIDKKFIELRKDHNLIPIDVKKLTNNSVLVWFDINDSFIIDGDIHDISNQPMCVNSEKETTAIVMIYLNMLMNVIMKMYNIYENNANKCINIYLDYQKKS